MLSLCLSHLLPTTCLCYRFIISYEMERPKIYVEKGLTEALHSVSLMLILGKRPIRGNSSRDAYSGLICNCFSNEVSDEETPIIF